MIFSRIGLVLVLVVMAVSLSFAATDDLESRFFSFDYTKKISMDLKDASLLDVLKIFSKESGKNFISAGDLSAKKITVYLDNISVTQGPTPTCLIPREIFITDYTDF